MGYSAEIVVSGHLCVDLLPDMKHVTTEQMLTPGRLYEIGPIQVSTGGCVSNTGLALHKLGVKVRLMSAVGDDYMGQIIRSHLSSYSPHLSESIQVRKGQASSSTVVLAPENADRTFLHCTGTNDTFGLDDIDFDAVAEAPLFHLGYPPLLPALVANDGVELAALFKQAKARGATTSMDMVMSNPNGPIANADWRSILRKTLPYVDIFVPSIEEMLVYLRRGDYAAWGRAVFENVTRDYLRGFADELIEMGSAIVGFKLGEMGLYLRTAGAARLSQMKTVPLNIEQWADGEWYMPAFEVEVVGTTGAGDSAYAAFLMALLRGMSPSEALRWACAVGACNVEAMDATSGVRSFEATQQRLATDWPTRSARLRGADSIRVKSS
ncbi:MAG: carbohydrate kinase family protein [Anaerolineae bacterium]|nr:carbohydrate kinase family protein [Anaerolineae bacterium]